MDYFILEKSPLFCGLSASELRKALEETSHHIQCYEKEEIIFHLMDTADRIGIVLEGKVQAQKTFPNGSQVNVSTRLPGDMFGQAAVFSSTGKYPCDVIALQPSTIMMFRKEDLLHLMQRDLRILENFTRELSSATYLLQLRIELFSYSAISQKTAFWLLMRHRQSGKTVIPIPDSVTRWALLMNVSRPSLHRELRKMEAGGYIRYASHQIEILDIDGLQDLLSESH